MKSRRSVGVTILAVIFLLFPIQGVYSWVSGAPAGWPILLFFLPFGLVSYGFFTLKNWARIFCIVWTVVTLLYFYAVNLELAYYGTIPNSGVLPMMVFEAIPAGLLIFYLTRFKTKAQFKPPPP